MAGIALKGSFSGVKNKKGQTAIEYVLLLLVMVSIISSLLVYVRNKYLGDPEKCNLAQNRNTILCKINSYVKPTGGNKPFQYFPFKK
ncbi:hypothetical protein SHI21_18950 [Bacteriovorax sp. PP10]|uniref:Class III signal peptide-containing protein n=1 Tax=Bacteriovorax antarcticus TaxID=3088717 RepID=A0ABU5VZ97_9BACT|nr:hypothetical protein [Bacteriovorax sp. PP10]MEA9358321.1 hypothetical protein [Bacteriovorax sp. PP10]